MYIKSAIFYMGGKYDLLNELLPRFPKNETVNSFIDLFGGGGAISLNSPYKNTLYNEINGNIVNLMQMLKDNEPETIINHIKNRIEEFDLNKEGTDIRQNVKGIEETRNKYSKNYFKFRDFYNSQENKTILDLYTLTFYSFCNLIRFNQKNEFNMPYGNRCFAKKHEYEIREHHKRLNKKNIEIVNCDAFEILKNITKNEGQFVYCDPPYTNTTAIYNEQRAFGGWTIEDDKRLFNELDRLNKLGVKWAMSNVLENKGKSNNHIKEWADKNGYEIIYLDEKEYSALGKGNANSREILVVNYETPFKQYSIFDFM